MSAWLLPDSIADVLPPEAAHIEALRRSLLDVAGSYGYELLMPPLVEHLESLLTGAGEALELQTFKLVDQLSGRMLGVRADTPPQVARIDAHVLARAGIARLCYCGAVLHTVWNQERAALGIEEESAMDTDAAVRDRRLRFFSLRAFRNLFRAAEAMRKARKVRKISRISPSGSNTP